jgi:glycosyltransferase involved in cell wall biosynthesis
MILKNLSVVIPCYNNVCYLQECLESLFPEIAYDAEVIVVDDGSTYDVKSVVGKFAPHIRYIRQEHSGASCARNFGVEYSTGKYIVFLDSDDYVVSPGTLIEQLNQLEDYPDASFVFSSALRVDASGQKLGIRRPPFGSFNYARRGEDEIRELLFRNYITTSSVVIRRSSLDRSRRFRDDILGCEDWDCWIRLALIGSVRYVNSPGIAYRVHDSSVTHTVNQDSTLWLEMHLKVLDGLYRLPEFRSRFASLQRLAYARVYHGAAELAFYLDDINLARLHGLHAGIEHARSKRWKAAARCLLIAGVCRCPWFVRRALARPPRGQRVAVAPGRSE